jgi:hypothetical protein
MVYFKVVIQNLSEVNEENHNKSVRIAALQQRIEPRTAKYKAEMLTTGT